MSGWRSSYRCPDGGLTQFACGWADYFWADLFRGELFLGKLRLGAFILGDYVLLRGLLLSELLLAELLLGELRMDKRLMGELRSFRWSRFGVGIGTSIRAMATLCSGGSVRTYSQIRSLKPGFRSKSSASILAQAFLVRPFALRVLLPRASSRPPWCCFRRRKVKQEYPSLGNLKTMPGRRWAHRNRRGLGKSEDLRFHLLVVAYGEVKGFDRVKGKRDQYRRNDDGGTTALF